jgi:hypothetical protein
LTSCFTRVKTCKPPWPALPARNKDNLPDRHKRSVTARRASPNRLFARIERRPFLQAHRVDQHHTQHLLRKHQRKPPHHQPAKRMPHHDVRRFDPRLFQQRMQLHRNVRRRPRRQRRTTPAQPAAIVGSRMRELGYALLNAAPIQMRRRDPRLEEHRRPTGSLFAKIQLAARPNPDPAPITCQ